MIKVRIFCVVLLGILLVVNCYYNNYFHVEKVLNNLSFDCEKISSKEYTFAEDNLDDFLDSLNVFIISRMYIEDRMIIEGYSNQINDYVVLNNNRINVQISVANNECIFGVPLIRNSF